MSAILGTLSSLFVYIFCVVIGAVIGSRPAVSSRPLVWVGKLQFVSLMVLITALGIKLGANEEVVSSLGQIGLAALLITVLVLLGSLLAAWLLRRFVLKLDCYGLPVGENGGAEDGQPREQGKADNALTKWIVLAVVLGMLAGHFVLPAFLTDLSGTVIDWGLYLLLFLVGMDMGRQGTIMGEVRAAGFKVLLLPLAVVIGTLAGGAAAGLLLPMGVKDAMAASSGLGWYSLAPSLLASYSASVSAVAFLSNVMREVFSIITIPFVAKHVGYVECAALSGAAAMDTTLPVIIGATHERITLYAFSSGVVLSLLVPVIVPAVVALPI